MKTFRGIVHEYRWLGLALLLAAVASTVITSCGGGGGSSDGGLCQQCGDTDGPCQEKAPIDPDSNKPCPNPTPATGCVDRTLICRRKLDSGQQRCYPANKEGTGVDTDFKCDGSRPAGTPGPVSATASPTPTPTADPALCGNGVLDNLEVCDGIELGGKICGDFCTIEGGILLCINCRFNFSQCIGLDCR
jgi:hypothetical protein